MTRIAKKVQLRATEVVIALSAYLLCAAANAADLKVMKVGLGTGTVTSAPAGINCGSTCDASFAAVPVILTASSPVRWRGDCVGTSTTCTVTMSASRMVRAEFTLTTAIPTLTDFTPEGPTGAGGIKRFLSDNPTVDSAAKFIAALPLEFKQNWILMTRSESLQTGTAQFPRILMPSADAKFTFSIGASEHGSYPAAHHNAIEYMQWDPTQKNFRFHEIVLASIPEMGDLVTLPDGSMRRRFPARTRGISIDDAKCPKCHSTRNVLNVDRTVSPRVPGSAPGTDGVPPGTVQAKNKPNWDAYDSWAGMLPFNRDRIYQGSVEAAAFRQLLNPWTWRANEPVRAIIEQLQLQPTATDAIIRRGEGTTPESDDGAVVFPFDGGSTVTTEPAPSGSTTTSVAYAFDRARGTPPGTSVTRGGTFVTLHHSNIPSSDEGRGVRFFDALGGLAGTLNQQRIADELINHHYATGSVPIDVRPLALAISSACLSISSTTPRTITPALSPAILSFFQARNGGMSIDAVINDTDSRATSTTVEGMRLPSLPRRKADLEKLNLDRTGDRYLFTTDPANGLIQQYGASTSFNVDTSLLRLRQEIFRRLTTVGACPGVNCPDSTVMGGIYVDREDYNYTLSRVPLYRFFLEPLGVSVDKWSMNVRGRSRSYNFADVFSTYANVLEPALRSSLTSNPVPGLTDPTNCGQLITAVENSLASLPPADAMPTYTDVQRIFNKSCIECHGGLGYPPYGTGYLDFSEDEEPPATTPPLVSPRLARSHANALAVTTDDPATSLLYRKITDTNEDCTYSSVRMMPCGGPPLSKVDVETIRRWIVGPPHRPSTVGDPHLKTVEGIDYDFQSAGEFVLLRDENLEIQARQTAIATDAPLGPNEYTGLSSCVSLNSAAAVRVGEHRITYQPNISGRPDPEGLQLRIDGKLTQLTSQGILLPAGGRITRTTAPGGIQIEAPGGAAVIITPAWWDYYQVWYMNIDAPHVRATQGIMGARAPGSWLPALPDGGSMGPRPRDLHQRYLDLYVKFADAWRVSDVSSLFDYASGTSSRDFTVESWPAENPQSCPAPKQNGGPMLKPPIKPLTLEVAQQHCSALVAADRKAHCIQDVMATGEPGFAKTYLLTEKIERNAPPLAPVLSFPKDNSTNLVKPVKFTWSKTSDADGDTVTFRQCLWLAGQKPTFVNCDSIPITIGWFAPRVICSALIVFIIGLLVATLAYVTLQHRRRVLSFVVMALLIAIITTLYFGGFGARTLSKSVTEIEPGSTYLWKVIAEDGNGGTTESETRRFTTK